MGALVQRLVVEEASKASPIMPQRVALVNPDGTPYCGPKARKGAPGASVKEMALFKDDLGAIVGGTAVLTDGSTVEISVVEAKG